MKLSSNSLLTINELSKNEILQLIELGIKLKQNSKTDKHIDSMKNKTMVMIFQKPSTRTRISFELSMLQLGGNVVSLSHNDLQLALGESIEDTAKTLSIYSDIIVARVYEHKHLELLASNSNVPVINGLSNTFHPCQILADFMTIKEHKKNLQNIKIVWIGDCTNVCNSLIYGCSKLGINMSIATPKGYEPKSDVIKESQKYIEIEISENPLNVINNADVIMTDTFISIHNLNDQKERTQKFLPTYRVNNSLMKKANKDAIFLHCLPAKRGYEVTNSVLDGKQSVIWNEVENRLYMQKALLLSLFNL
ncbi:MAG: ornithine carbamoyltransferase [Thaumarchaeota archaeon]|nr:ornithine carbamoyltransferase [Nitrososphaerota archaeon]MCY3976189.1 ornithine carbamoyltransferase [Nitrososphaerota archaeon]